MAKDYILPPEVSNTTVTGPEKSSLAKSQDKDYKIAIMNMFKDFKKDMNKSLNEVCANTTSGRMKYENNLRHKSGL